MRLIRSVRRSVSNAVLLSLVTALVLSRIDYGNATLAGLLDPGVDGLKRLRLTAKLFD